MAKAAHGAAGAPPFCSAVAVPLPVSVR
jgi:hypothetical protein